MATRVIASTAIGTASIALEWKPADLWVGLYTAQQKGRRHVWVCILPCLPIHVSWVGR
jgi:hypothetical protein